MHIYEGVILYIFYIYELYVCLPEWVSDSSAGG